MGEIIYDCPHCGTKLAIAEPGAGLIAACSVCGKMAAVYDCPHCGTKLAVEDQAAGFTAACQACGMMAAIPAHDRPTLGQRLSGAAQRRAARLRMAAEQGDVVAQTRLGACYEKGEGVPKDAAEAMKWYRRAANQGDSAAQYNLARCYADGEGVAKQLAESVKWLRRAAEQGNGAAQNNLGVCYANGEGVAKDLVEAYKWVSLAAAQGEQRGKKNVEELEKQMTPEQIAEGQRLSLEFKPKAEGSGVPSLNRK